MTDAREKTGQLLDGFWGSEGDRPYDLTEKQALYCIGITRGLNKTRAAEYAGYSDPPSMGSNTGKAENVVNALAAYDLIRSGKAGPMDSEEAWAIIEGVARHGTGPVKLTAAKMIAERDEKAQAQKELSHPELFLLQCASDSDDYRMLPFQAAAAIQQYQRIRSNYSAEVADFKLPADSFKKLKQHPGLYALLESYGLLEDLPVQSGADETGSRLNGRGLRAQ